MVVKKNLIYCKFENFRKGFYFRETLHMCSFVKIKASQLRAITLSLTDIGKSSPSHKFSMSQILKFPDLQWFVFFIVYASYVILYFSRSDTYYLLGHTYIFDSKVTGHLVLGKNEIDKGLKIVTVWQLFFKTEIFKESKSKCL